MIDLSQYLRRKEDIGREEEVGLLHLYLHLVLLLHLHLFCTCTCTPAPRPAPAPAPPLHLHMHTCTSSEPAHLHLQVGEVEERDITTVMDQKNYIEEMNRYQFGSIGVFKSDFKNF